MRRLALLAPLTLGFLSSGFVSSTELLQSHFREV
jgi:hypothetical protein